jgi:hypothetical protein
VTGIGHGPQGSIAFAANACRKEVSRQRSRQGPPPACIEDVAPPVQVRPMAEASDSDHRVRGRGWEWWRDFGAVLRLLGQIKNLHPVRPAQGQS